MPPHAESVSIGIPESWPRGPGFGSGKAGGVRPRQTLPEARQSWERLGHGFKAWHDFDQRHPILRRLALLPFIGPLYRKARRRHVLRASGKLVF
ncbi:hypothetical protein WJ972_34095 [Achromobacter insuavis]